MNNSIAVHSHTDLINIYNNECNNYSESVNNRYCICNNILLKLIIPVIILAVITLGSIMVKASETDTRPYLKKYYTSVEVTSDDTLWSLEADNNNGLEDRNTYMTSDTIITGNHLLLYYYSSEHN